MTEIHVERRARMRGWLWLAAIVAAMAIVWALSRNAAMEDEAGGEVLPEPGMVRPGAFVDLDRFTGFAQQTPDFGDVNRAHEYTRTGLNYLADAIVDVAADTGALRGLIAALRQGAQELKGEPVVDHLEIARVVFSQGADAIAMLQRDRAPWMAPEVATLRQSVDAIDAERPLSEQPDAIKAYFTAASSVLTRLGASAPPRTGAPGDDSG